jgi:hypothetical protein
MGFIVWLSLALLALLVVGLGIQSIPTSEYRRRLAQELSAWRLGPGPSITGTVTSASAIITAPSSVVGVQIGMLATGTAIPAGTHVIAIDSSVPNITLSASASATHAGEPITFSWDATGANAEVHLYAAAYTGGLDPLPSDFTEATFDTYAAQDVTTVNGPYTNADGSGEADFGNFGWVLFANPTIGNTIYGYWVDYEDPVSGVRTVALWEDLPSPLPMEELANAVVVSVPMTLPDPGAAVTP